MSDQPKELSNRVVILNGFTDSEIMTIMAMVKALYASVDGDKFGQFVEAAKKLPETGQFGAQLLDLLAHAKSLPQMQEVSTRELVFAKTTPNSVNMVLKDLIVDMSQDHEYLMNNPPDQADRSGQNQQGSGDA